MDDLPTTRSFTPLATIPLAHPHVLHPDACNPTMDLVVLILEDAGDAVGGGGSAAAFGSKGKGKAGPGVRTKVALWRMSGSKVWEVDVAGRVLGLAWSRDGRCCRCCPQLTPTQAVSSPSCYSNSTHGPRQTLPAP